MQPTGIHKWGNSAKELKNALNHFRDPYMAEIYEHAIQENPWFTRFYIDSALSKLKTWFEPETLDRFWEKYGPPTNSPKKIGIIMAGNIPFVGFQDLVHVLLSGHKAVVKLSHKDRVLMTRIRHSPNPIRKRMEWMIRWMQIVPNVERMHDIDFLLATGSNNTARQLEYTFRDVPKVIRKNRFSAAVLRGTESGEDLKSLADDIFLYNGMGCRNVSLIFIPNGTDPRWLLEALDQYPEERLSPPYLKLLKWEKARTSMLGSDFIPGKHIVIHKMNAPKVPSVGMLNWVEYGSEAELSGWLSQLEDQLQCVVGKQEEVAFGTTQEPALHQFADNVDVMEILKQLG